MKTSMYSILCIVVRLGAVLLAVYTVVAFLGGWPTMHGTEYDGMRGVFVGTSGLALVLAAVLWLYPGVLARMAAGRSSQQVFESPLRADETQTIALAVLGVAIAMGGLGDLLVYGLRFVVALGFANTGQPFRRDTAFTLVSQLPRIAIGIGLALGARGLAGLILRLRDRGGAVVPESGPADEEPPP
jgi:hypothetical protein